jgi:hypothetical protein
MLPFLSWRDCITAGVFAAEVQAVVALRMMLLARGGPDAAAEARGMVTEKLAALCSLQIDATAAFFGGSNLFEMARIASTPIRQRVRNNRRRLSGF